MMGLSDTEPMCTGLGVWDLEGHMSQGWGQEECNPHRRFLHPRAHGSWRWGQQMEADASATDRGITLYCTCARSSWSLISARLGWAGAVPRYLVSSLALLLIFIEPSVRGCLSFPPTGSHPSRLDAADPGPCCG